MSNLDSKSTTGNAENTIFTTDGADSFGKGVGFVFIDPTLFASDNAFFAGMTEAELISADVSRYELPHGLLRQPSPYQLDRAGGLKLDFEAHPPQGELADLLRRVESFLPVDDKGESRLSIRVDSGAQAELATKLVAELKRLGIEPSVVVFEHDNAYFDADLGRVVYNGEQVDSTGK